MKVKSSTFFAAGPEYARAIPFLSDGAFRLFTFLSLNANRQTGCLEVSFTETAQYLAKSKPSIISYFKELRRKNVCQIDTATNQYQMNRVEILDEYWPYEKEKLKSHPSALQAYLEDIKFLLSSRVCMKGGFSQADERIATQLFREGIPFERIRRGIVLGCARKIVGLLNGTDDRLIGSFKYFINPIQEVGEVDPSDFYSELDMHILCKREKEWLERSRAGKKNEPAN